jgi:hypothetical protein
VVNVLTLRQAAGRLTEEDVIEINGWLGAPYPTSGAKPMPMAAESTSAPAARNASGNGKSTTAKPVK